MTSVLLQNHLSPLKKWLDDKTVSEISINRPGEIWVEIRGIISKIEVPELTTSHLRDLAQLIATSTQQKISTANPLLSAHLPQGHRVQIIYPPAVNENTVAFAIRQFSPLQTELSWFNSPLAQSHSECVKKPMILKKDDNYWEFLQFAIRQKYNILISGGTSTGKTTFLNSLLQHLPREDRIVTIEDVPEIQLSQPNYLSLFATRHQPDQAKIDMQDLVEASLRLRPDRLIIGELRGAEAFSFLRAVNTGHPGSIATLHADSPRLALEQLTLMVMQKNLGIDREQIEKYVSLVIDVIVQLKKDTNGNRYVSEIYIHQKPLIPANA